MNAARSYLKECVDAGYMYMYDVDDARTKTGNARSVIIARDGMSTESEAAGEKRHVEAHCASYNNNFSTSKPDLCLALLPIAAAAGPSAGPSAAGTASSSSAAGAASSSSSEAGAPRAEKHSRPGEQ
jgi:hypothetical protein